MKVVVVVMLLSTSAYAQNARVDLAVGQTATVAAGNAIGWFCDDPTVVSAVLVARRDSNDFVITGVNAGSTQCRVGTELGRATFVIEVHVAPNQPTITR